MDVEALERDCRPLAVAHLREGWDFTHHMHGALPPERQQQVDTVVDGIEIEPQDKAALAGYVDIFARGAAPQDRHYALAVTWRCIEREAALILEEGHLGHPFEGERLAEEVPALVSNVDEEGLLDVAHLRPLADAFQYGERVVFPYRGMHYSLAKLVCLCATNAEHKVKVRLDPYRVIPRREYKEGLFEALVRGRLFDESLLFTRLRERKQNLLTVLERRPVDLVQQHLFALDPIDYLIVNRKDVRERISFLAEELRPLPDNAVRMTTKIFHADLPFAGKLFDHADSTLLVYSADAYRNRQRQLDEKFSADGHFKLYWLQKCNVDLWSELFRRSMYGNELVDEYLSAR